MDAYRALSVLLSPNRPEKRHREGTTRYLRTTSLVCRRKIASISFCPDLLPRPRNQFSAGLSSTLILLLKRFGGTRCRRKRGDRRSTTRKGRWKKSKSTRREGNTSASILTNKSTSHSCENLTTTRALCLIGTIITRPSYYTPRLLQELLLIRKTVVSCRAANHSLL